MMLQVDGVEQLLRIAAALFGLRTRIVLDRDEEMTIAQWRLSSLLVEDGWASIAQIADYLGASPSAASRLVSRSRERGLVTVTEDQHDRRITRVSLTALGRQIVDEITDRHRSALRDALAMMGTFDAEDLDTVTRIADAIAVYA